MQTLSRNIWTRCIVSTIIQTETSVYRRENILFPRIHLHYSEITSWVLGGFISNLLWLCLHVFPIMVRQLFACLTQNIPTGFIIEMKSSSHICIPNVLKIFSPVYVVTNEYDSVLSSFSITQILQVWLTWNLGLNINHAKLQEYEDLAPSQYEDTVLQVQGFSLQNKTGSRPSYLYKFPYPKKTSSYWDGAQVHTWTI